MRSTIRAILVLLIAGIALGGVMAASIVRRGVSARDEPGQLEVTIARAMRHLAIPQALRNRQNPVPQSEAVLAEALEHFADHCAVCHGNDGSGETVLGRGLYPKAPDMRGARTQSLTDGELFSIIENGVRLTGMPAWGDGSEESARASWSLVHAVRHLPAITPEEIERMEQSNPRTPAEFREDEEARRFLEGDESTPAPAHEEHHH